MEIKRAETNNELHQILALQKENHLDNLSANSKANKGFLTVMHSFEMLITMNTKASQIIAKDGDKVVAYALVMLKEFKNLVPVLIPMFENFEQIIFKGSKLSNFNYYVMGQICVDDAYKRQGVLNKLYLKHKEVYSKMFDYCVTEVSSSNIPSMLAHEKTGFKTIHTFKDATDEWNILVWDWN
ncbi:GNAT family N-acetyltransferase [Mariniflexile sp. AS56]|uniref:GNAT family N-acetyltransferase n=1 Tax=Mariniflexile sp. AS56 TaxID=3063957 RepID=UPI0026EB4505|nr:GNAT family N-acetyltransferase [Mariniflexile sp. AS56]MDO7172938.1 GNAT family N-acetyltransferase [Mariniflexile sp. AS56]